MKLTKESLITGFALFSMFFGAGNLILPPNLGFEAGDTWFLVTIGFMISAVILPLLGIFAHARLQGTLMDFGKKVSPSFSMIYCILIYLISITLPSPRTASVTHEIAIAPFFGSSPLLTSMLYFILVLFFVLNRSKILDFLGKFLTPIIFVVILSIICVGIFIPHPPMNSLSINKPLIHGLLEGYQTFDAIAAVVVGGVLIISLNLKGTHEFYNKRLVIRNAGVIAGIGLFITYAGLIYNGALFNTTFPSDISRTQLLSGLSYETLGNIGSVFLSILVSIACFTTAVGIITGTSDFFKGVFNNSSKAYIVTAITSSILGVLMGQFDVQYIIIVAIPALVLIYPITIVLIVLNVLPERWGTPIVFRAVVLIAILFSIPDFLAAIGYKEIMQPILNSIPLGNNTLGWVLPVITTFILVNLLTKNKLDAKIS
ncbi:branched-chain amino acid transport system II carrier protein [Aquimarina sp. W85]|uniref:branched-chain amino acid transport system II carrier protein n=1 Tax=Aquimarina rhodophyticola TaxID=3342246 RepID=UPI0036725D38